jgi:hypothetical protein
VEEAMSIAQEESAQPISEEDAIHFTQEIDPGDYIKPNEEEKPQHPLPELKPLPSGLKYAFLHNNKSMPVVISDKLTESETRWLIAVLVKYRSIIGYSL